MPYSILIVEDNDSFRNALNECLRGCGYDTVTYADGPPAIEAINKGLQYDLAIVDLVLLTVEGAEVITASKRKNPAVPVFSMTGASQKTDSVESHFKKPFRLEDLVAAIESLHTKKSP